MVNEEYCVKIINDALNVCGRYKPKFGKGGRQGVTLDQFHEIYSADTFYSWFGLDSSQIYAAHRAAGGITSIYRQIGLAMEKIFRYILQEQLNLQPEDCHWRYSLPGSTRVLKLDGRIEIELLKKKENKKRVEQWIDRATAIIGLRERQIPFRGVVFECRQDYKSKDAKRQNADLDNAASIIGNNYLPCIALFSQQIDSDVTERYVQHHWLLLKGTLNGTVHDSVYVFSREILKYDLAKFFERNTKRFAQKMNVILDKLLRSEHSK